MAKHPDMAITKELYPAVSALCGGDSDHVERTIRSAIGVAWRHRDHQLWQAYFPADPQGQCKKPSNGSFITRLAQTLTVSWSEPNPDLPG